MLLVLAGIFAQSPHALTFPPPSIRYRLESPLPAIPAVTLDTYQDGMGIAQQTARAKGLQGRMLWIDGTANLDRVSSEESIHSLVAKIADSGFNTIVFDIKPISGQVLYKSEIAPKIEEWKGQHLPKEFDPVPAIVREAHANGLQILVSMNAFSEGHSLFKVGPGYSEEDHQTVVYTPHSTVVAGDVPIAISSGPTDDGIWAVTSGKWSPSFSPSQTGTEVALSVDSAGKVAARSVDSSGPLSVPSGGCILVGRGPIGQALLQNAPQGAKLRFETTASFDPISQHPELQYPLMMNPTDPWVQDHALAIVREVLSKYPVDGMLYDDRLRYAGIYADFSQASRAAFDRYVGKKLNWPDEVFRYTLSPHMARGVSPGPYYDAWMTWRTLQMRNWVGRVRETVKRIRPTAAFGVYGGSWFGDYHALGTDYAAPSAESGFWFMTPKYQKTGFGQFLDILVTGCYYQTATIAEAMEKAKPIGSTVEAAGQLSNALANDQCWTYAGIELENFKGDPDGLQNALQAACGATQGVMVFDLSHDIEPMWPVFKRAFTFPAKPPLSYPAILLQVRKLRAAYDKMGARARPVPINSGASGTGF